MLLYELNTAFEHGLWDRYDYLSLLNKDLKLWNRDHQHRTENHYSLPQDSFYALSGCKPLFLGDQPNLMFWHKVVGKEWFRKFQEVFDKSEIGQILAVHELTTIIEEGIEEDPPEEIEMENEDGGTEEDDSQENDGSESEDEEHGHDDGDDSSAPGDRSGGHDEDDANDPGEQTGLSGSDGENSGSPDDRKDAPDVSDRIGPQNQRMTMDEKLEAKAKDLADTLEERANAVESLMDYVGSEAGSGFSQSLWDTVQFVSSFDVKRLSRFFGFARNAVRGVHRNGDAASGQMRGYKNVEWSENLHPVDQMGVASRDLRTLAKVAEGSLRARTYKEERPMGRGPVIFLRDESQSVHSIRDQMRELEIALALAFNAEKRDLISIAWCAFQTRRHTYGDGSPIPHLSEFFMGGTRIYHVLDEAFDIAKEYVEGTDIVVLTDGEIDREEVSSQTQEKMDEFKKNGGRIWVILVKDPSRDRYARVSPMPWMDLMIKIENINESKELEQLLASANRREGVRGKKRL